jgi:hypothetical protein
VYPFLKSTPIRFYISTTNGKRVLIEERKLKTMQASVWGHDSSTRPRNKEGYKRGNVTWGFRIDLYNE